MGGMAGAVLGSGELGLQWGSRQPTDKPGKCHETAAARVGTKACEMLCKGMNFSYNQLYMWSLHEPTANRIVT